MAYTGSNPHSQEITVSDSPSSTGTDMVLIAPESVIAGRGVGRPTKYTPETVDTILGLLRSGNTRRTACLASGVSVAQFSVWLNQYPEFAEDCQRAEQEAIASRVGTILQAADKGAWQAAAWWLERRHPKDWAKTDRIEIINSVRQMARIAGLDEDEAAEQAQQILRELRSANRQ